ncbi:hypothetical protein [Tenacibaculum sp. 190524A05c]|uniref:hypothetical protein n=1 Tax=Tenacibaculum platacis TaxID=3137852 RepID=UPI0031FB7963
MNFDNYLFRPHAIVNIMGGVPKPLTENQENTLSDLKKRHDEGEKPLTENQIATFGGLLARKKEKCKLTDGSKKYLEKLVYESLTKRSSRIKNKYTDKGIQGEDKSFTTYSRFIDKLMLKNKIRKENEYFSGECDNAQKKIRDIKTSWSYETFPLTDSKIKNNGYQWQLDCYMDLWGLKEAELIYVLIDTPSRLLEDELRKLDWKFFLFNQDAVIKGDKERELVVETICNHIFTSKGLIDFIDNTSFNIELSWFEGVFVEIPEEMRVKIFHHEYCEVRNNQLKQMIDLSREYMNEVLMSIPENQKRLVELTNNKAA